LAGDWEVRFPFFFFSLFSSSSSSFCFPPFLSSTLSLNLLSFFFQGLALAQLLKNSGIQVTIYERDEEAGSRWQGFLIGLNEQGLSVITSLGVPHMDDFLTINDSSGFAISDANLKLLMQVKSNPKKRDSALVNRWKLREILTYGLSIEWNKKFLRYEEVADGVIAHFQDGTTAKADILIGADGAKSRVRAQKFPQLKYEPTGILNFAGYLPTPPKNEIPTLLQAVHKTLLRLVTRTGHTSLVMGFKDEENRENILWVVSNRVPPTEKVPKEKEEVRRIVLERAKEFHPEWKKLIEGTPIENFLEPRPLHCIAVPTEKYPPTKATRVTVLGMFQNF
jgi:2-polyprenyl-6-methoxyphenol hydroxylase-like FAD-dependent oxidoreductase